MASVDARRVAVRSTDWLDLNVITALGDNPI